MSFYKNTKMLLNPNCSEVVLRLKGFTREHILTELKKIGIIEVEISEGDIFELFEDDDYRKLLGDIDNPNIPDFEKYAFLEILDGLKEYDIYEGAYISGDQHLQEQLFPTMYKIVEYFNKNFPDFTEEWTGFDGGTMEYYENWIEEGMPEIEDFQSERSKELRKKYCKFE